MSDGPNPMDGAANESVPSFFGQKDAPASGDVFTTRRGDLNPTPAPGNGSLPPGAMETPGFTKRTPSVTKQSFLKKIGE